MWLNYSIKNLVRRKSYSLFFIINFTISLSAVFLLAMFQINISNYIRDNSKQILTADLSVSARRDLTLEEQSIVKGYEPDILQEAKNISSYSMVYFQGESRLVLIKAITKNFPLYGEIALGSNKIIDSSSEKEIFEGKFIWVYPEILLQMGLKIGDSLKIGEEVFEIKDSIERDVGLGGLSSSLAPALYMSLDNLKATSLLGFGSVAWYSYFYKIRSDLEIEAYTKQWSDAMTDPAIQVSNFKNANQQLGNLSKYLNDYLGLVGMVCVLLSLVGAYYLFRNFLIEQAKNIGLLEINGASSLVISKIFLLQIVLMSVVSVVLSIFVSYQFLPLLAKYAGDDSSLKFALPWVDIFPMALAIVVFIILSMYPFLRIYLRSNKTDSIFGAKTFEWSWAPSDFYFFILPCLCYFFLSVYVSHSWSVGGLFCLLILIAAGVFYLSVRYIIFIFAKISPKLKFDKVILVRYLSFDLVGTSSIITALGFSFLLMLLIPQIQSTLGKELRFPQTALIPDLFLFDIQDDQVEALVDNIASLGKELQYLSPMIMARLTKVNEEAFEKGDRSQEKFSREQEQEERFRNRGFNLSFRSKLSSSESLVAGEFETNSYSEESGKLPSISLEERFADRLKLKMGDKLSFDVQGVEISGQVKSIRQVKWTSFQPNFFILFQDGVLNEAPKTYLGALSNLSMKEKADVQLKIVQSLPNISIVDVQYLVTRILSVFDKMAKAILFLAIFSFLTGFFLVFVIANYRARSRKKDYLYLKLFGANRQFLLSLFRREFLLLVLLSLFVAFVLSYVFSWVLAKYLFDADLEYNFYWAAVLLFGSLACTYLVAGFASRQLVSSEEFTELLEA